MQTKSVQSQCDVFSKWDGTDTRYRVYVNDELFTERSWIWSGKEYYLEEIITIEAPPGQYEIKYELLAPATSEIKVKNMQVISGTAVIHKNQTTLEILS
jgi:hypothetical protein